MREPIVTVNLYMPQEYVGSVITLCIGKRGVQMDMSYHGRQVKLVYEMPMAEIVLDFFDRLKSTSRGYASMDYEFKEYRAADVVKVDMLINSEKVDALAIIVHRANAPYRGRQVAAKMRELIPRQMFDVAIQAAIGATIISRENVKALRKNVLAKCYGGDISRKKKLLEKQKAGKKRMKQVGSVEIPQEAFLAILTSGRITNEPATDPRQFCADPVRGRWWSRASSGASTCSCWPSSAAPRADAALAEYDARHAKLTADGIKLDNGNRAALEAADPAPADLGRVFGQLLPGDRAGVLPALLPVRAVQDPVVVDGADPAGGRPDPGEQVRLRHPPAGDQQEDHRGRQPAARRRDGVQIPEGHEPGLHQARHRRAG